MPELIPFSEWSSINEVSDNPEGRVKYANYVRDQYIAEKTYDEETETALQKSLGTVFQAKQFDPAEIEEAIKPKPFSFDEKFNLVTKAGTYDFTPEEYEPLIDYRNFLSVSDPATTPDYDRLRETKRAAAQPIIDSKFNSSVEQLVARGDVPFARVELSDGSYKIIGGGGADNLDAYEAYQKSISFGALRPEDMATIQKAYEIPEGYSAPRYKIENYGNALLAVQEAFKADPALHERIHSEFFRGFKFSETNQENLDYDISQIIPDYVNIPEADRIAALDHVLKTVEMTSGYKEFDDENPKNNLVRTKYGEFALHRDALARTDQFEATTEGLTEAEKKDLESQRKRFLESSFDNYAATISDTYLKDDWLEAVASGKAENKSNADILTEFLDKQDYSYFKNEIRDHIGETVVESVTDIFHGLNVLTTKSESSLESLMQDQRERRSRQRLANLFGQNIGMEVELGSMIAPVVVDMIVASGLAAVTGGLSATAVVAKNAVRASLKGVVDSMASSVLKSAAKESVESVTEKALAKSLASQVGTKATAKQFFDTYYKVASNKITTNSAFFATASTRSGVMTYATVYDALDGKGLTDEERHEKAASAGLTAGLITGGITVGFNLLGRAGLEGFLNAGATRGQFRKYFDLIVGKGFNDVKANDLFDRTVATIAKRGLASTWKDVAKYHFKNFSDEAVEEGLDEFVNSYVVSSATGDDMPLQDRLMSAGMAAFYGGVFGLGMPVAQRTLGRLVTDQQAVVQRTFVDEIVEKLRGTDSELTAQAVIDRLNRGPVRPKPEAPTTRLTTPTDVSAEIAVPLSPEVVQELDAQIQSQPEPDANVEQYTAAEQAIDADQTLSDTEKDRQKHQLKVARRVAQILQQDAPDQDKQAALAQLSNLVRIEIEQPTDPSRSTPEDVEKAIELLRTATNEQHEAALQAAIAAEPPKAKAKNKSNKAPKPAVSPKAAKKVAKKAAKKAVKKAAKKAVKKAAKKAATKVAKKAATKTAIPAEPEIEVEPDVEAEAELNVSEEQINTIRQKAIEKGVDPDAAVADVQDKIASLEAYSLESQKPEEAPVSEAPVVVEPPSEPEDDGMFGDISKEADHIRLTAQHLATKVQRILESGIPIEVSSANPYGLPLDSIKHVKKLSDNFDLSNFGEATPKDLKSIRAINRLIKSRIAEKYPQLPMETAVKLFKESSPKKPTLRTKKVQGVEFRYDEDSKLGVFDNNPTAIARMLKAGMKVPVPVDPKRFHPASRYLKDGSVLNPSIEVEKAGKKGEYYVTDVSVVDPNDPSRQISLVYDKFKPLLVLPSSERAAAMDAVLTVNESFTLNLESSFETTRGKDTLTIFDGSPIEVGQAMDQFSFMLDGAYRLMTTDNPAEVADRLTPQQVMLSKFLGSITRRLTPSNAANIARDNAKVGAIVDFYYDSVRAIKMSVIRQTLDQTGAIALDPETGKLKIKNSPEVIETLAGFITLPVDESGNTVVTDYTPSRGKEPFATDTPLKQKASYLLNYGFSGSGEGGKADVLATKSGTTPKPDWAEITLLSYFDREINTLVSQSSKNNQNLNLAGIAATAAGRIKENLPKFQSTLEQTGTTQTSLDSLQESGRDLSLSEQGQAEQDLEDITEDIEGSLEETAKIAKKQQDKRAENVGVSPESYSKFPEEMQDAARSLLGLWSLSPDADSQIFKQVALKAGTLSRETIKKTNNTQKLFKAIMKPFMKGFAESEIIMNEFQAAADSLNPITRSALVTYGVIEDINLSEDVRSAHRKARRESSISYDAPAIIDEIHAEYIRSLNDAEITRLNLESGNPQSVVEALKTIAETSDSESNRNVASLLLKHQALLLNTGFAIEDSPSGPAGSFTVFSNDDTVVTINRSQTYGDGLESVLLHEYVHAVTARLLGLPPSSMTKDQRAALARLKGLYEMAKQNSTSDSIEVTAGLSNFAEFIAAMFSSPTFQNEMQVLTDSKTNKSFFEKILDALLDFFGIRNNSVLRKSFDDLVTFAELGYSVNHMSAYALIDRAVSNGRRNAEQMVKVPFLSESFTFEAPANTTKTRRYQALNGDANWIAMADNGRWVDFNRIQSLEDVKQAASEDFEQTYRNGTPFNDSSKYVQGVLEDPENIGNAQIRDLRNQYGDNVPRIVADMDRIYKQKNAEAMTRNYEYLSGAHADNPIFRSAMLRATVYGLAPTTMRTPLDIYPAAVAEVRQIWEAGDIGSIKQLHNEYKNRVEQAAQDQLSAESEAVEGLEGGVWVKLPQVMDNMTEQEKSSIYAFWSALSRDNWCTSKGQQLVYAPRGPMYVFRKNDQSLLAIRFEGDEVVEIQSVKNDSTIPAEYVEEVKNFTDKAKLGPMAKATIAKAESKARLLRDIEAKKADGASWENNRLLLKDGTYAVDEAYVGGYADVSIAIGDVILLGSASAPKLTTVGGDVRLKEGATAPALTTVGGGVMLLERASAPKLTTVYGYVSIFDEASAPKLTTVGGNVMLSGRDSAPALTTVGGNLRLYEGASAPVLTTVGGSVRLGEGAIKPLLYDTSDFVSNIGKEEALARGARLASGRGIVEAPLNFDPLSSDTRYSLFGTDGPEIEVTGQQQARIDKLIDEAVSSLIPKAVPVSVVRNAADAEAFNARPDAGMVAVMVEKDGVSTPAIFIARDNIAKAMANVQTTVEDDFHAKAILEALIHEELAHVSEFKALPTESIDEIADSLTQYEFEQVIDSYTSVESINADLKMKVAENDTATKRQIVGEMLRMQVQKITRGTTTEEDIAFYMTNPSLARVLLRHLVNVFRKLYARYNLNKSNPELAIAVNRMATQMAFLSQSGSSTDPVLSFDPRSPDEALNILERRFAAMSSDVTEDTSDETILDMIKDVLRPIIELPVGVYEGGDYKAYTGMKKFLMGSLDPRVVGIKKSEQLVKNAIESLGNSALVRFEKIRKKHPEITDELINRASGSTESDRPSQEFRDATAQLMREWRRDTRKKVDAGELPANALSDEAKTEAYQRIVVQRMAAERKRLNADVRRKVSEALAEIRSSSPELAQAILDVRQLIDTLSDTMKKTYGLNEKLQAKFDSQMGIYITRAYRAFNEVGYIDKILADTDSKVYQDAHNFFRSEWLRSKAKFERSVDKKLTLEASMVKAEEALQNLQDMNIDPVHNAMQLYLYSRDITKRRSYKLPEGVTRSLIDSLRKRDEIPVEIRNLLGEYGPEEGIKNMFRTLTVVTNMLTRQATYNNLIKVGRLRQVTDANGNQVEQGFVMTHDEIKARFAERPELASWVNLRTGKKIDITQKEKASGKFEENYDFTYSYYAPEDMVTDMHERFDPKNSLAEIDATEKGVSNVVSSLNFLTGASLSAKTLFSAGFYIRNILGNVLFFGPSQGFILTPKAAKTLYAELKRAAFTPEQVDVYRAELISFGIIGEDIFSKQISELFDNSFNIDEANKEIGKLTRMARKAATFSERNAVMKRLRAVSAAVDAFYKIAYFEHEIKNLKKARDYDLKNNTDTGYRDLSDYDIKSQAAVKVRKTAQSYADSLHLVEAVSKKYGAFLTPFLRFKTEVPRIMVNTWTLSGQEMRSDNPVIKWRGRKRRAGIIGVSTAFGMLLPTVFRLLQGIGEDEDELMRESVPPYLRLNTFFYTGEKGDLQSWDLTFLNPYAMMTDPILRFGEKMARGEPSQAFADMLASYLGTYADIQIFANAVLDVKRNQKSRDGQAIYSQNDGMEIFYKSFKYILSEAYGVRTPTKLVEALKAATVGDDAPDPDAYSPLQIMLNEVMPVRPHPVDPEQMMTRFLLKKRDERAQARSELNRLLTRQSLSQDDIRDTAREWADKNADINAQIYRGIRAASSLGLSYDKVVNSMSRTGVRKDMQVYLTLGLMPRSELSTPFKEALINLTPDGAVGLQRLMFAQDELNKQGAELIPLNP